MSQHSTPSDLYSLLDAVQKKDFYVTLPTILGGMREGKQVVINLLEPELFFLILAHLYIKCEKYRNQIC